MKICYTEKVNIFGYKKLPAAKGSPKLKGAVFVIKISNHIGTIKFSAEYLANLASSTASSCFGVTGLCPCTPKQRLNRLLGRNDKSVGVMIVQDGDSISVDLHISAALGVNLKAITDSIAHKVAYVLTDQAGVSVSAVNVYVDG